MRIRSFLLASLASIAMASPVFAACENVLITETPNVAPVYGDKFIAGGGNSLNGTAYTVATFCPAAAAAGTCTGESLSTRVNATVLTNQFLGNTGDVPDVFGRQFYIEVLGNRINLGDPQPNKTCP